MSVLSLLAARGTDAVVVRPSPWVQPANIVVDGNSIYADFYTAVGPFSDHIFLEEPFASSGFTHGDTAVSGQTWQDMTDNASDVTALYQSGKSNVLVASETTNSIYTYGRSATATVADATQYIARVRYSRPDWYVLLVGSLPAEGSHPPDVDLERNLAMIETDGLMADNFAAMGADGYIGLRDLPPFTGTGTTTPYAEFADCWHDHIHPSDIGKVYLRQRVVQGLLALGDWPG